MLWDKPHNHQLEIKAVLYKHTSVCNGFFPSSSFPDIPLPLAGSSPKYRKLVLWETYWFNFLPVKSKLIMNQLQAVLPGKQHPCQTQDSARNQISRCYCLLRKIIRSFLFPKDSIKPQFDFYLIKIRWWGAKGNNSNLLMLFGLTGFERNWFHIMDFHLCRSLDTIH